MNVLTKSIVAAVTAAVLCTANTSAISANSYTDAETPRYGVHFSQIYGNEAV